MNEIKIWVFKESGKWYTEEDFEIPKSLTEVNQVIEYIELQFKAYKGMHIVIPFTESFIENGYPCMILAEKR